MCINRCIRKYRTFQLASFFSEKDRLLELHFSLLLLPIIIWEQRSLFVVAEGIYRNLTSKTIFQLNLLYNFSFFYVPSLHPPGYLLVINYWRVESKNKNNNKTGTAYNASFERRCTLTYLYRFLDSMYIYTRALLAGNVLRTFLL